MFESDHFVTCCHIPEFDRAIMTTRNRSLAILRKHETQDVSGMSLKWLPTLFARTYVPNGDFAECASRCQQVTLGGECL